MFGNNLTALEFLFKEIAGYNLEHLLNMDETGFFSRFLPNNIVLLSKAL